MFNGFCSESDGAETRVTLEKAVAQVKTHQLMDGKVKGTHAWSLHTHINELVNELSIFWLQIWLIY